VGLAAADWRYLYVIRHAKSEQGDAAIRDHERALNPRGTRDGHAMEAWFGHQGVHAQWVWSSSARRAQQTAAYVTSAFNAEVIVEPQLYLASAETLLGCIQQTPETVRGAAIVAHNPGVTHLANLLGQETITDNLVTFGTVLFRTLRPWTDLQFGTAELLGVHTPKTI